MLGLAALCSCAVLLAPLDAFACSPIRGYTRPTNIELVQRADAIVIAKSRRLLRTSAGDRIVLSVEDVIKGAVPVGEELVIRGTHAAHTEPDGEVEDFSNPRRGAFAGGCIAYDYSLWGNYLELALIGLPLQAQQQLQGKPAPSPSKEAAWQRRVPGGASQSGHEAAKWAAGKQAA